MTHLPDAVAPRLVLVGMMGAGKSSVGRALAARLGWPYLDNDDLVRELAAGVGAAALAATRGVDELHRLELAALDVVLGLEGPLVASAAGFVVEDAGAAQRLRERATVAWLRARPETLRTRIGAGDGRRADARSSPWLAGTDERRAAAFAAVAHVVVDVDDRPVDEVVRALLDALGSAPGLLGGRR